jgi:hypothetical protein
MYKAARALVLILLLACSAQAGIIQNEQPAPPPSDPATAQMEPADTTAEPTADGYVQSEGADSLTQFALDVLAVLPSLF